MFSPKWPGIVIDPLQNVWEYYYNSANELTEIRDAMFNTDLRITTMQWNETHDLISITRPAGVAETFSYTPGSHLLASMTDGNQHGVTIARDGSLRITSITDARGKVTTFEYDSSTKLLNKITDRNGHITTATYDTHGNLASVTRPLVNPVTYTYDAVGRVKSANDGLNAATTYDYDNLDRLTTITYPGSSTKTFTYDGNGNLLIAKDELNHPTTYVYNSRNWRTSVADVLNHTTSYQYDGRGLLTAITDPLNNTTTFEYDGARRRISVTQPAPAAGGYPVVTSFGYNPVGELTALTDPSGNITQFANDVFALTRTKTYQNGTTEVSQFDIAGNLTSFKDTADVSRGYDYDENNRLISQNCPSCGAGFFYDDEGNLTQVADVQAGTYAWAYDDGDRVLTSTQPSGSAAPAKVVSYSYDVLGRRQRLTYPDGIFQTYGYDNRNRLTSIPLGTNNFAFDYDAASRRTKLTFPGGDYGTYTYDNADRMSNLTWYKPASPNPTVLNQNAYIFDNADRITSYSETHNLVSGTTAFGYDKIDRLISTTPSGGLGYPPHSYTYDQAGNRVSVSLGGGPVTYQLQTGGMNRYASAGSAIFSYDAKGNMTGDGTRTMAYDTDNNLTQVTAGSNTVAYIYDWMHRVAQRTQTGTNSSNVRYIYDEDWNVLCDVDGNNGTMLRRYVRGLWVDETLAQMPTGPSETPLYLCANHLGSTTAVINAWTNDVYQHFSYDEYGAVQVRTATGYPDTAAPATRYLFTGRENDPVTGLNNNRHRYYSPPIGRWLSRDPIGKQGGINLYAYVGNTPSHFRDPFGLEGPGFWDTVKEIPGVLGDVVKDVLPRVHPGLEPAPLTECAAPGLIALTVWQAQAAYVKCLGSGKDCLKEAKALADAQANADKACRHLSE